MSIWWLPFALLCACDGGEPASDGAVDAAGDSGADVTAAPTPPTLTPCPAGWREAMVDGVPTALCEPWPESGMETCPRGEAHFPGEAGCLPIGAPCPAGPFAEDLPTDRTVVYVSAAASSGGDGSIGAPYPTIGEGLTASANGDVVAIAKGTYEEELVVPAGRTLWGACTAETRIEWAVAAAVDAVVSVRAANVVLRGLSIGGARPAVIVTGALSGVTLEGVEIDGATNLGIGASSGFLSGHEIVVRNTAPNGAGSAGMGVLAQNGATVTLTRAVIARNTEAGVSVESVGTEVRVEDAAILDTQPRGRGTLGRGMSAQEGAHVVLERVVLERNAEVAVLSRGEGTAVELFDVVARDTLAQADGYFGRGISAQAAGRLEATRTFVDRTRESAVYGVRGGNLVLRDVVVLDALPMVLDERFGMGIALLDTPFEMERVAVIRGSSAGVSLQGPASIGTARDLIVRDTEGERLTGGFGRGLNVQQDASLELIRARFIGNRDISLAIYGASMRAEDLVVEATRERACAESTCASNPAGIGLGSYSGAEVDVTRLRIADNPLVGAQVAMNGQLDLHMGVIMGNAIGANVQVDGYDVARLSDGVDYRDNGVNLDSADLMIPDPSDALPDL